jgi:hypothetical protein
MHVCMMHLSRNAQSGRRQLPNGTHDPHLQQGSPYRVYDPSGRRPSYARGSMELLSFLPHGFDGVDAVNFLPIAYKRCFTQADQSP